MFAHTTLKSLRTHWSEVMHGGLTTFCAKVKRWYRVFDSVWAQFAVIFFHNSMYRYSVFCLNHISIRDQTLGFTKSDPVIDEISAHARAFYRKESQTLQSFAKNLDLSVFDGKRVLYIGSDTQYGDKRVTNIIGRLLERSAIEINLEFYQFEINRWHSLNDKERIASLVSQVVKDKITHLVVCDNFLWPTALFAQSLREVLRVLSQEKICSTQVIVMDAHVTEARVQVSPYVDYVDHLICQSSWSSLYGEQDLVPKIKGTLTFVDQSYFAPSEKFVDLFFSGYYMLDRHRLLSQAGLQLTQSGATLCLNLTDPSRSKGFLSDAQYRKYMRSTRAVLNITTKGFGTQRVSLVTGRAWEAFAAGAALIQHSPPENDSLVLDEFFICGEEYFQFSSDDELFEILNLFTADFDQIAEVAKRGHERYLRDYSAIPGWMRLLS